MGIPLSAVRRMLRVNHAGEVTASRIYEGQLAVLRVMDPTSVPLIREMKDQEDAHLKIFTDLVQKYDARPSVLQPLCNIGGWLLGAATALVGPSTAMACTEAVESVVGDHYNAQLRELLQENATASKDKLTQEETKMLASVIAKCRDEELEHLDHAVDKDAHASPVYQIAFPLIKAGVSAAIFLAHRF